MSSSEIFRPKIAYVEMEPAIREIIIGGLRKHGFVVNGYDSAESFLTEYEAGFFDSVASNLKLSNLGLSKMNGFDLFREVKRIDPKQKCMCLTAFRIGSDAFKKAFPDFDIPFVMIPIRISDLVREINKALGLSPLKAE